MYYPILRGRQNEMLAIKELLNNSVLSSKIVPVIEPVKLTATVVNTLKAFADTGGCQNKIQRKSQPCHQ